MQGLRFSLVLAAGACLVACSPSTTEQGDIHLVSGSAEDLTAELHTWLQQEFEAELENSPNDQYALGRETAPGRWSDPSAEAARAQRERFIATADEMNARFDRDALSHLGQQTFDLRNYNADLAREERRFLQHSFVFSHMTGPHSSIPSTLINQQPLNSEADAERYIARIETAGDFLRQSIEEASDRFEMGIQPPDFMYPRMISTARNIIADMPYSTEGEDHAILADFRAGLEALDIDASRRQELIEVAAAALQTSLRPAYEAFITLMEEQAGRASGTQGANTLPDGRAYYQFLLRSYTSTDLTAEQIHAIGLQEVERILSEMAEIRAELGIDGGIAAFLPHLQEQADQWIPNTPEGRTQYIAEVNRVIDAMRAQLPEYFNTFPNAALDVLPVEPYRAATAPAAFYEAPTADGSRAGIYYLNLERRAAFGLSQIEAVTYHEALPGHHMQLAIARELTEIPEFRSMQFHLAHIEGWGLYAELLSREMGFYDSAYSDYNRLNLELLRAVRLVVDTGLHHYGWTRDEANAWIAELVGLPVGQEFPEVDRYMAIPGQATTYFVGRNAILAMRAEAQAVLGEAFDIRGFHDAVLVNGTLPLAMVEANVDRWVEEVQAPQ